MKREGGNIPIPGQATEAEPTDIDAIIGAYVRDRQKANSEHPARTIERGRDTNTFTLTTVGPDGNSNIERFNIETIESPENPIFQEAYQFIQEAFESEESFPIEVEEEIMRGRKHGYELGTKDTIFAIKNEDGEVVGALLGHLTPLRAENGEPKKESILFIVSVVIAKKMQRSGFGREIVISALNHAKKETGKKGQKLIGTIGECVWTSRDYWEKLGLRRIYKNTGNEIREISYVQPPLDFNLQTGEVEEGAGSVSEHLMVTLTPEAKQKMSLPDVLMESVRAIYKTSNYIDPRAFQDSSPGDEKKAKQAHQRHVEAIRVHEEDFRRQFESEGTLELLSQRDLESLRQQGKDVVEVTTEAETETRAEGQESTPENF